VELMLLEVYYGEENLTKKVSLHNIVSTY